MRHLPFKTRAYSQLHIERKYTDNTDDTYLVFRRNHSKPYQRLYFCELASIFVVDNIELIGTFQNRNEDRYFAINCFSILSSLSPILILLECFFCLTLDNASRHLYVPVTQWFVGFDTCLVVMCRRLHIGSVLTGRKNSSKKWFSSGVSSAVKFSYSTALIVKKKGISSLLRINT